MPVTRLYNTMILLLALFITNISFAEKLTIVTEHLAPFQIVKKDSISGLSTEIVVATLKHAKFDYSIEAHPWSLAFKRGLNEKNTCLYSLSRIPTRENIFQWVGQITKSSISLHALRSSTITLDSLEEAKNYKIAVIKDDVTHHFLLEKGFEENKNFYVMSNYDSLLKLLETPTRQIDFIIINDDLINNRLDYSSETSKYKSVLLLKDLTLDFYFACSIETDKEVIERLRNSMATLEKKGLFISIRDNWNKKLINIL